MRARLKQLIRDPKLILKIPSKIMRVTKSLIQKTMDKAMGEDETKALERLLLDHEFINGAKSQKYSLSWLQQLVNRRKTYRASCFGYFFWQVGLSESTKQFFNGLVASGVGCNILPFYISGHKRCKTEDISNYRKYLTKGNFYSNQIYFINADGIVDATRVISRRMRNKRVKKFAIFWWEFNDYFYFDAALTAVDHIIVFSDFIKEAVEKAAKGRVKVTKLLYSAFQRELVHDEKFIRKYRADHDLNDDDYIYFFFFYISSCFERKNPMGLLEAFKIVLSKLHEVKLVLKVSNADNFEKEYHQMLAYINENNLREKVVIDCNIYPKNQLLNIMNIADCYVSLHRSEGLGGGLIEAMQLGKPVIATNFGGNTDFMNKENSCLVDYVPCGVKEDYGPYKKGFIWADPNIEQAADYMLRFAEYPEKGRALGLIAKQYIQTKYSAENVQKELSEFFAREFI